MMSISRSTASLETTSSAVDLSRSSKLSRLSKAYSLTDLNTRSRSRTTSSEGSYNRETASSKSKSRIGDQDTIKERTISRITKNIENDRNADKKFTAAYREKWKGVMNQTATRTETKKRDSALLSGSNTKPRLPAITDSNKLSAGRHPGGNTAAKNTRATSNGPRARSGRPDLETGGRNGSGKADTRARSRSSKPDLSTGARNSRADNAPNKPAPKSNRAEETRAKKNFNAAVNRAAPTKSLAGTVKRATNVAQRNKPVDDFALNKKYSDSVCEPCKLQIHEKLKRGYAKYKSLDTMKACEKCKRVVIDFDFYQICIECAKSTAVCAKCAAGSTKMTGARFVEVVRNGVEENILSMNSNELKKFAEKHAKIEVTERKIDDIEQLGLEDQRQPSSHPNSRKASGKSTRGSSGSRSSSTTSNSPSTRKLSSKLNTESPISTRSTSSKAAQIARSLTSSSSPLVDKETINQSGNESDEAYASGHISSTDVIKSATNPNKRNRKKSSDILRQIRSLSNLEVTSPTLARSVIREIRSLTAIDTDEEGYTTDEDLVKEGEAENPSINETTQDKPYTPFSCDKSLEGEFDTSVVDSPVLIGVKSAAKEEEEEIPEERMWSSKAGQLEEEMSVEDYFPSPTASPIPAVRSLSNTTHDTGSEAKLVKDSPSTYNKDIEYSEVKNITKSAGRKKIQEESDEEFWVEDVELFEDSEIEYAYKTDREEDENNKKNKSEEPLADLGHEQMVASSVKDYTETVEELAKDDMVEHVHIEAERRHTPDLNDSSDPGINLDLHQLTETEFTDVIEIEHEVSDLTPRNENYGTNRGDDIHFIDYIDKAPRSTITDSEHDILELDPSRSTKKISSVETPHYTIEAGDYLHVYDYDERSSSCEEIESRSGDHGDREMEDMKTTLKPNNNISDMIIEDNPSHHEDSDRPSSLTVIKGSPEDAVMSMGESDHVFNRPFGRTEYERQNGQVFHNGSKTDADAIIDKISEGFEQFVQYHQDHTFEVLEGNHDYEQEYGYYECYQYPYNPRLRIRLEDIPEEGTLSKETTYMSTVYNETFDKEDTMFGRDDSIPAPITRDPTMEDHAVDIVTSALHNAVIQVESCRQPSR